MSPQFQPQTSPNPAARWFSRVVWLGILFNLFFISLDLFAPDFINVAVGLTPGFPTVWNRAHAVMVLALSILYIPAAVDPLRYSGYSWLLVVSRLAAAIFWAWCVSSGQGAFGSYLASDGAFCVVQAILLQVALPAQQKLPAALGHLFAGIGAGLKAAYRHTAVRIVTAVVVVVLLLAGWVFYDNLLRHEPELVYSDIAQHYKYAAIGLGPSSRVPYWVFKVLPDVFADMLPGPGGYRGGWRRLAGGLRQTRLRLRVSGGQLLAVSHGVVSHRARRKACGGAWRTGPHHGPARLPALPLRRGRRPAIQRRYPHGGDRQGAPILVDRGTGLPLSDYSRHQGCAVGTEGRIRLAG